MGINSVIMGFVGASILQIYVESWSENVEIFGVESFSHLFDLMLIESENITALFDTPSKPEKFSNVEKMYRFLYRFFRPIFKIYTPKSREYHIFTFNV